MPIYEYQSRNTNNACPECRTGFEILQGIHEKSLSACPYCGKKIRKIISRCHSAVIETSEAHAGVEKKLKDYERAGMWSHAAELADTHSEKTKNKGLKMRALDNYQKAGYDTDPLERHAKLEDK